MGIKNNKKIKVYKKNKKYRENKDVNAKIEAEKTTIATFQKREYIQLIFITAVIILIDRILKYAVIKSFYLGESVNAIGSILKITYTTNSGAGFSMLTGMNMIFIWLSIIIIGALLYYLTIVGKKMMVPIALILGGALGNLIDRVFYGYVIDFIQLPLWPVFNIADSTITIGAIVLIIMIWKEK